MTHEEMLAKLDEAERERPDVVFAWEQISRHYCPDCECPDGKPNTCTPCRCVWSVDSALWRVPSLAAAVRQLLAENETLREGAEAIAATARQALEGDAYGKT